jgi:Ca2+-binding RTX toxin-like protein
VGDGNDTSDDGGDELFGESGADTLKGEAFSNLYHGGSGPDDIDARFSDNATETIFGGPGNDHIQADDGVQDTIRCGGGTDTVVNHDSLDRFPDNDCETIN